MNRLLPFFILLYILQMGCSEPRVLPVVSIKTTKDLDFDKKKAITFTQIGNMDTITLNGTAKWRGGWSRQFGKRSFTFDTEYPISLAGMNPHTKWILNASYIDKTLMRHRFWYDLWRSIDDEHQAADCRFVNLYVNGNNQGIYVAMERIHESRLGIESTGVLFKDPQVFRKDSISPEEDDSYFHQKFPEPTIENRDSLLFNFRDFIITSDSLTFSNEISEWVDLDNIIDWHLLLLLSHNGDGLLKNFYLYKLSSNDPLKVIPWDYDHSAGRDGDNELNLRNTFMDDDRNILLDRLMTLNAQNYNNKRCRRWWVLRETDLFTDDNIIHQIDILENKLGSGIDDNFKTWPYDGPGYYDKNDHNQEVQLLKEYLNKRIPFLDNYFDCQKIN